MTDEPEYGAPIWGGRSLAAPASPGGTDAQKRRLIEFLEHVDGRINADWLGTPEELTRATYQLGKLGLTAQTNDGLVLSAAGRAWLETQDDATLFDHLHGAVAFFGEILADLAQQRSTVSELLSRANKSYQLPWRSPDQIRRRLAWLRVLDLIEEGPDRRWLITNSGKTAIARIHVLEPEELQRAMEDLHVATIEAAPPLLKSALEDPRATNRQIALGYLPKNPVAAIQLLVRLATPKIARVELLEMLSSKLSLTASSANSFMQTARTLGVYEYVTRDDVSPTPIGAEFASFASAINLARLMHVTFLQFGEVLPLLGSTPMQAGEIHRKLFAATPSAPSRDRTTLVLRRLADARAVTQVGPFQYAISPIGRALAVELPMKAEDFGTSVRDDVDEESARPTVEQIGIELTESATDSAHPERFELSVANAISVLGVSARHIGGPGRTDVLVRIQSNLTELGRLIVDAKTSASGSLREDAVVLDTLKEHAEREGAGYIVVVAPGYEHAGRLPSRAAAAGIALLTAEELAQILRDHHEVPYRPDQVLTLLSPDRDQSQPSAREDDLRKLETIRLVLGELTTELDQANAQPITPRDIYRLLRRDSDVSESEVAEALDFLSNPWIRTVAGDARRGYTLPASRPTSALAIAAIARAVKGEIADHD